MHVLAMTSLDHHQQDIQKKVGERTIFKDQPMTHFVGIVCPQSHSF